MNEDGNFISTKSYISSFLAFAVTFFIRTRPYKIVGVFKEKQKLCQISLYLGQEKRCSHVALLLAAGNAKR
jgi:hypothetical protein